MTILSKEDYIKKKIKALNSKKQDNEAARRKLNDSDKKIDLDIKKVPTKFDNLDELKNIFIDDVDNRIFSDDESLYDKCNSVSIDYDSSKTKYVNNDYDVPNYAYICNLYYMTHKTGRIFFKNNFLCFRLISHYHDKVDIFKIKNWNSSIASFKHKDLLKNKIIKSINEIILDNVKDTSSVNGWSTKIDPKSFMYEAWQGLLVLS